MLAGLGAGRVATAFVGLVVAILTALDSLFRFGFRWQQARRAADAVAFEGWEFLERIGRSGAVAIDAEVQPRSGGR